MTFGVVTETYGERETELALLGFVELASLEASAHEVKLGFGHCCLQAEDEPIVEIAQIVAAIVVDNQSVGQGA